MRAYFVYENLLKEDYSSISEIYRLAEEINKNLSPLIEKSEEELNKVLKEFVSSNNPILLSDIVNPENYNLLKSLITSKIGIFPSRKTGNKEWVEGGGFTEDQVESLNSLFGINRETVEEDWGGGVFLPNQLEQGYKKGILKKEILERYPGGIILLKTWYISNMSLIHELQHIYDWIRSKGKAYLKNTDNYSKKQKNKQEDPSTHNSERALQNYFRDINELSSFFSQVILSDAIFVGVDNEFRDIHWAWKIFLGRFSPYKYLTPKQKKIIARKFSQIYYKKRDEYLEGVEKSERK
jgi:hypothetical protein